MRALITASALLLLSCASPLTQLIVVVETNLDVPLEIDAIEVAVTDPDGISTVTPQALDGPDAPSFPLTLGVTTETETLAPITITAIARLGRTEVVRQSATVTLTPGETRVVHLVLYRSCVGRECDAAATCDVGGCVGRGRDDLPLWTGTPPTYDDSDPCLAMSWDVDGDGEGSDACGGTDCDDAEPLASSAAEEVCDGIDNNCDGITDEDCDCSPLDSMQACTTTCGSTGIQTCTTSGWATCVFPEEICNGADDDCDGLTDEGLLYEASTPTPLTTSEHRSAAPDLIWTDDHYALVWHDDTDRHGVHFQTLDRMGAATRAAVSISDNGQTPAIAWSGSTYGAFWWRRETVTNPPTCIAPCSATYDRMMFSVLGADGVPIESARRIESDAANEPRPSILWDGAQYILGYRDGDMMLEARGEDGERIGDTYSIPSDRDDTFEPVWTGTQLALSFTRGSTVYFTQGMIGSFPDGESIITNFERPESASMVWTGDGFVVAVSSNASFRGLNPLESMRLDAAGVLVGTPNNLSPSQPESGFNDAIPPGMATAPGQLIVTWVDDRNPGEDVYFARLAPDGSVLQPATRVSGPTGSAIQTTVAWSGQSFGTVWSETILGDDQLMFADIACAAP